MPLSAPAANSPPPAERPPLNQKSNSQVLIAVAVAVAFQLFDKLHLHELFAGLTLFLLFSGILLACILSYSADDRNPFLLGIHGSVCVSLFGVFVVGFFFQVPLKFFLYSCLAFLGLIGVFVGVLLVLFNCSDLFKLWFERIVNAKVDP